MPRETKEPPIVIGGASGFIVSAAMGTSEKAIEGSDDITEKERPPIAIGRTSSYWLGGDGIAVTLVPTCKEAAECMTGLPSMVISGAFRVRVCP